tara:strand:- start:504 stop:875 length:372 start_codon:yes stop_codon:yes gene_type:complete
MDTIQSKTTDKIYALNDKITSQESSIDDLKKRLAREETQLDRLYEEVSAEIFERIRENVEVLLLMVDRHAGGKQQCNDIKQMKVDTENPRYCFRCFLLTVKENPSFKPHEKFHIQGAMHFTYG